MFIGIVEFLNLFRLEKSPKKSSAFFLMKKEKAIALLLEIVKVLMK